jgi:molybdate transport system substrate-binding protein
VQAAELTVLASPDVVSAVRDVAPAFEKASGHKVIVSLEAGRALMAKILHGAPADVATSHPSEIDAMVMEGKLVADTRTIFARGGIVGVAVLKGAPKPDISSAEAFKRAMLNAKSVAYARRGASGVYTGSLMARLGIREQMLGKTRLVDDVPVAEVVAKGEAEIGLAQISLILPDAGVDYVGPLPAELQEYVDFAVGVLAVSKEPEAAKALVKFMSAPGSAPLIRKSGMEPAPH